MEPKIKKNGKCTFHRDGTISYWDIYCQKWARIEIMSVESSIMASLTAAERRRVRKTQKEQGHWYYRDEVAR